MVKKPKSQLISEELPLGRDDAREDWEFPVFVKTFRIAATGDVRVTQLELDIIDTADFQRLQGVRQLGPSIQVYPTALHTRFDHSLGCLAMVDRMVHEIRDRSNRAKRENPEESKMSDFQRALARLYALLHDVTHVPFGHTIEDELKIFTSHDDPDSPRIEKLLGAGSDIGKLIFDELGADGLERFRIIFSMKPGTITPYHDEFIHDLVSNTVCADLLDYIRRDSYFCGLDINFEYRFLSYLYLGEHNKARRVLVRLWKGKTGVPRRDVLTDLTRLLEARYMIAERVYFHHAKIIAGSMIGRAILEAKIHDVLDEVQMCDFSDDTLIQFLIDTKSVGKIGQRLASEYKKRKLYKIAQVYTEETFALLQAQDYSTGHQEQAIQEFQNSEQRYEAENCISEDIGAKPGEVLIYAPTLKMNTKVARMLVQWKGNIKELGEVDDPIVEDKLHAVTAAHGRLWAIYLLVHPSLSENQASLAKDSFEEKFLNVSMDAGTVRRRKENVINLLRENVRQRDDLAEIKPSRHEELLQEAAKEYMSIKRTSGAVRPQIGKIVRQFWVKLGKDSGPTRNGEDEV